MLEIPKRRTTAEGRKAPGPWWHPLQNGDVLSATIRCPDCQTVVTVTSHSIDAQGVVTPSVVCPMDGCSWHVWVKLAGWQPK